MSGRYPRSRDIRTYQSPTERREPPDAKLQAKAVIIDGRDVLLTCANMTNATYDRNVELGVLCRGQRRCERSLRTDIHDQAVSTGHRTFGSGEVMR